MIQKYFRGGNVVCALGIGESFSRKPSHLVSKGIMDLSNCNEIRSLLWSLNLFLMIPTAVLKTTKEQKKGSFRPPGEVVTSPERGIAVDFIEEGLTLRFWTDIYFATKSYCTLFSAKCSLLLLFQENSYSLLKKAR